MNNRSGSVVDLGYRRGTKGVLFITRDRAIVTLKKTRKRSLSLRPAFRTRLGKNDGRSSVDGGPEVGLVRWRTKGRQGTQETRRCFM